MNLIYGDVLGGRWQVFAYPFALLVTTGAVLALWHNQAGPLKRGLVIVVIGIMSVLMISMVVAGVRYVY